MSETTDIPAALKVVDLANHKTRRERQEFLDKAFLVALELALKQDHWTRGEEKDAKRITSLTDRVDLAIEITEDAYKKRLLAP